MMRNSFRFTFMKIFTFILVSIPKISTLYWQIFDYNPKVPIGRVNGIHLGGHDEESTYTHLMVGYWEYVAMMQLFGKDSVLEILRNHDYYTWVYKKVLDETDVLKSILERNSLIPDS
jgi:hypothetical protein